MSTVYWKKTGIRDPVLLPLYRAQFAVFEPPYETPLMLNETRDPSEVPVGVVSGIVINCCEKRRAVLPVQDRAHLATQVALPDRLDLHVGG